MFYTFESMTSLTQDSEHCNLITSWELIKTPPNLVQGSVYIKPFKLYHKNKREFVDSGPL